MTTTIDQKSDHPPLGGSSSNTFDDETSSESLSSSIPEFITLNVVLPDGTVQRTEVSSSKPMLDLAVQLAAANHLSPTDHTLALYHPETGRQIEYKASQLIGSFRVDTVHLVNKKSNKGKTKNHTLQATSTPPFEITNRLAVNLPKNQKMVLRVKPQLTLADIFKMICNERNLDPYKHELRHPTQPNMPLNMASTLSAYNINEITVVSVLEPTRDVLRPPPSPKTQSIYNKHWSYSNSMPRSRPVSQPPPAASADQAQPTYMPGMAEKKKKKGFMSFFSRKKEGKFTLSEATYNAPVSSGPPPSYEAPIIPNGSRPQSEAALNITRPSKKKRPAPAPPVNRPLSVDTNATTSHQRPAHSRDSSHSSGFDEANVSPLESPSDSSGKVPNNVQTKPTFSTATSASSKDQVSNGQATGSMATDDGGLVSSSTTSTMSRNSSMSTGGDSSLCSLPRNRKKRKAPPPPQNAPKPNQSTPSPTHNINSGRASPETGSSHSPDHGSSGASSQADNEQAFDTRQLQMAIAEELKKEVSCDSYLNDTAPESPTTPSESSQVSLQRQKSDVAVFVEQMTELTEGVKQGDLDITTAQNDSNRDTQVSQQPKEEIMEDMTSVTSQQQDFNQSPTANNVTREQSGHQLAMDTATSEKQMDYIVADSITRSDVNAVSMESNASPPLPVPEIQREEVVTVSGDHHVLPESCLTETTTGLDRLMPSQGAQSESSTEESLSNLNIEELSDEDTITDVIPGVKEPVQLVKKKINPEFTLNLEDEEDEDKGSHLKESADEEEFTEVVITGEITTTINIEDYKAALAANNDTAWQSTTDSVVQQSPSLNQANVKTQSKPEDVGTFTRMQDNPERSQPETTYAKYEEEISLDNADVTYVSPVYSCCAEPEHVTLETASSQFDVPDSLSLQDAEPEPSHSVVMPSNTSIQGHTDLTETTVSREDKTEDSSSPPSGMSLLSIVSEVKSKPDVKHHIHPKQIVLDEQAVSGEVEDGQVVVGEMVAVEEKDEDELQKPVYKSLRDAYKNKSDQDAKVLIIPKPEPFQLPPQAPPRTKPSTDKPYTSTTVAALEESKVPSGNLKDIHVQPVVYKKESLAVSKRAPRMSVADVDERKVMREHAAQRFWGPRPWSARETSHDVPTVDVSQALMRSREAITRSRELPPTSDLVWDDSTKSLELASSAREAAATVTGLDSPARQTAVEESPKNKCSDISFSPRSEEEDFPAEMEEKSITMLAYPVERKSIPRQPQTRDPMIGSRQYSSSLDLDATDSRQEQQHTYSRQYSSTLGLSEPSHDNQVIGGSTAVEPVTENSAAGVDADNKEKAKRSLQQQYADVQQHMSKWQKNIMENQRLLPADEGTLPSEESADKMSNSTENTLTEAERQHRWKMQQNFMRLSTPRPFTQRTTDPDGFKPKPIMKKPYGTDEGFAVHAAVTASGQLASDGSTSAEPVHRESASSSYTQLPARACLSSKPPPSPSKVKPRFEPKLDPREELMIAIRNAGGRRILQKTHSADTD